MNARSAEEVVSASTDGDAVNAEEWEWVTFCQHTRDVLTARNVEGCKRTTFLLGNESVLIGVLQIEFRLELIKLVL